MKKVGLSTFQEIQSAALRAWVQALAELDSDGESKDGDASAESSLDGLTVEDAFVLSDTSLSEDAESQDDASLLSRLSSGARAVLFVGGRLIIPAPLRVLLTLLSAGVIFGAGCYLLYLLHTVLSSAADRLGRLVRGGVTGGVLDGAAAPVQGVLSRSALGESFYRALVPGGALPDRVITSDFGSMESFRGGKSHGGVDFSMPEGTRIHWPFPQQGTVVRVWNDTTYGGGLSVQIADSQGGLWGFAHLSDNSLLREGDVVSQGDVIGVSGSTGRSTGPHLHVSYRRATGGLREDPLAAYAAQSGYATVVSVGASSASGFVPGDMIARGNPMNLQYAGFSWEGSAGHTDASMGRRFVNFTSPVYGVRAGAKLLRNYQTRKDLSGTGGTAIRLSDIGKVFVGGNLSGEAAYAGDDIEGWVTNVSQFSGFAPDELIDLRDSTVLSRVVRAVSRQESGSIVSEEMADTAVSLITGTVDDRYNSQGAASGLNVQRR